MERSDGALEAYDPPAVVRGAEVVEIGTVDKGSLTSDREITLVVAVPTGYAVALVHALSLELPSPDIGTVTRDPPRDAHLDIRRAASRSPGGWAAIACYVPAAIGQALLAEGGRDGAHLRSQVRLGIMVAGGLMVIGAAAATLGRHLIVTLYRPEYREAADVLPALVVAAIPWAVTSIYLTEARVRHRSGATVLITAVLSLAILVPALVLVPEEAIQGAATAFLFGNILAAVVALAIHVQGRSTSDAEIPTVSPDDFEPEDAITLTPLA